MAKSKFFRVAVEGNDRRAHHHPRMGLNRWPKRYNQSHLRRAGQYGAHPGL